MNRRIQSLLASIGLFALSSIPLTATGTDLHARSFEIAPQSVSTALKAFASQSELQLIFTEQDVGSFKTTGITGSLTPDAALAALLRGTGLKYEFTPNNVVVIRRGPQSVSSNEADANPLLLAQSGDGKIGAGKRFYSALQTAQNSAQSSSQNAVEASVEETRADRGGTQPAPVQEVVVTGSRVATGVRAPTPMTVLGAEDLQRVAPQTIANIINQLPEARASVTPRSTSNEATGQTGNFLDLRGLGVARTLVLVDGHRFVSTRVSNGVDIDVVPQALISGIDVVTGGASAVYGSDAVSGVVNLKLDTALEGGKALVQGGISEYGDEKNYLASVAYGHKFAGGRGHAIIAVDAANNEGISLAQLYDRDWAAPRWGLIANPAYTATNAEPQQLQVAGASASNRADGGLINAGPLRGIQFGPGGTPMNFQYGNLVTASTMQGGTSDLGTPFYTMPEGPSRRRALYGRLAYDITENVEAFAEFNYGQNLVKYEDFANLPFTFQDTSISIRNDNAYLPASIRTAMAANGITTFTMGRNNFDYNISPFIVDRKVKRGVAGLKGEFGDGWMWDAYYTYGRTSNDYTIENSRIPANFALAIDAVVNPATGAIVCRSALASPTNGCVPLNPFGPDSVSAAASAYVNGIINTVTTLSQSAGAASVRGQPFSTWAGPVDIAIGGEFRRERTTVVSDPRSAVGGFTFGNLRPWTGSVSVKEGFAEALVPLARDKAFADAFDLNLAARLTDYSTSGSITSWKAGATYQVNDDVRFRAARSRDIRAPSPFDLFSAGATTGLPVFDPTVNAIVPATIITRGNASLEPETAKTWTAGVVLSPTFAPGLMLSVDYFNITINDAISTLTQDQIVTGCFNGMAALCSLITRPPGANLTISFSPINLDSIETSGVDFDLTYRVGNVLGGDLTLRGLASYTDKLVITSVFTGINKEYAGSIVQPSIAAIGGVPHWKANVSATYTHGRVTGSLTGRYVGGGVIDTTFTGKNLNVLSVNGRIYTDVGLSYDLIDNEGNSLQVFGVVNNALNQDPPIAIIGGFPTARTLYDFVGRTYTAGVRVRF